MKVIQANMSDYSVTGGAGITMHRLHLGLKKQGVESKILCRAKQLESADSILLKRSLPVKTVEVLLRKAANGLGLTEINRIISSLNIRRNQAYLDADIINWHVIHSDFISYLALPSLTKSKPTVLTLHDMWAFTGHCTYSYDCSRWKTGCGKCPYPEVHVAIKKDGTALEWKLKDWVYSHSNLSIVAPSKWLTQLAKQSMLSRFPIHHIPLGVDTEVYRPLDVERCRLELGIAPNKKVLMFVGSLSPNDSNRKGADLLLKALQMMPASLKAEIVLLTMGGRGEEIVRSLDLKVIDAGYVADEEFKAQLYAAADVYLFPTRADNSPVVMYESMACGTPIVSFNVGGVPDLVRPGTTGLLAEAENAEKFRDCIVQLLEDHSLRSYMRQQCRDIALREYSLELYVQRHVDLYRQLLPTGVSRASEVMDIEKPQAQLVS